MKKVILNFVVVAIVVLTVSTSCSNVTDKQVSEQLNEEQQVAKVERWEYKQIYLETPDGDHYDYGRKIIGGNQKRLNNLGAEGWELVSIAPKGNNGGIWGAVYTFKRKL
jgi:hypothetical protein